MYKKPFWVVPNSTPNSTIINLNTGTADLDTIVIADGEEKGGKVKREKEEGKEEGAEELKKSQGEEIKEGEKKRRRRKGKKGGEKAARWYM